MFVACETRTDKDKEQQLRKISTFHQAVNKFHHFLFEITFSPNRISHHLVLNQDWGLTKNSLSNSNSF